MNCKETEVPREVLEGFTSTQSFSTSEKTSCFGQTHGQQTVATRILTIIQSTNLKGPQKTKWKKLKKKPNTHNFEQMLLNKLAYAEEKKPKP